MDNVGIVVDDLEGAIDFFRELGLQLEGRAEVAGDSVDNLIGLENARSAIAMMRMPDGHGRLELCKFHNPPAMADEKNKHPNTLGIRRIMFAVDDIDDVVTRLQARGAQLLGDIVQYEDIYRLCYMRGPEGILIALAEELRS